MFKSVKSLERKIARLIKEVEKHRKAFNAAKTDKWIHSERMKGAQAELDKAKADLVLAKAKASRKEKGK